mmetsp:Transcript_85639/g.247217  ORF Transcript_85639/g.247217 Transcript_85639/m.247217 type:complete len:292 (+) Transcript_85639:380-1255(+)
MDEATPGAHGHGANPQRVHVELLPKDFQAPLKCLRRNEHVLDNMLGVVEFLQLCRRGQLEEADRRWKHPSEAPTEERAVAKWDNVLHLPEHGPAVSIVVVAGGQVLDHKLPLASRPVEHLLSVSVEVFLVPLRMLIQHAVLPDAVGKIAEHHDPFVLREDKPLDEPRTMRRPGGVVFVEIHVVPTLLGELDAFCGLGAPEIHEALFGVERVVFQADVAGTRDDPQFRAHEHSDGAIGPKESLEQVGALRATASYDLAASKSHLKLDAELLEEAGMVGGGLDARAGNHASHR